ncbi:MAG: hypothetical protein R2861_00795 [Desulfobacterales bacterium]
MTVEQMVFCTEVETGPLTRPRYFRILWDACFVLPEWLQRWKKRLFPMYGTLMTCRWPSSICRSAGIPGVHGRQNGLSASGPALAWVDVIASDGSVICSDAFVVNADPD